MLWKNCKLQMELSPIALINMLSFSIIFQKAEVWTSIIPHKCNWVTHTSDNNNCTYVICHWKWIYTITMLTMQLCYQYFTTMGLHNYIHISKIQKFKNLERGISNPTFTFQLRSTTKYNMTQIIPYVIPNKFYSAINKFICYTLIKTPKWTSLEQ